MDGLNLQIDLNQNVVRYPPQAIRQGKGLTLMRPHQASTYDVSYHYGEILILFFSHSLYNLDTNNLDTNNA